MKVISKFINGKFVGYLSKGKKRWISKLDKKLIFLSEDEDEVMMEILKLEKNRKNNLVQYISTLL